MSILTNSEMLSKENFDAEWPETISGTGEVFEDTSETERKKTWEKYKMYKILNMKLVELFELEERLFGKKDGYLLTESRMQSFAGSWKTRRKNGVFTVQISAEFGSVRCATGAVRSSCSHRFRPSPTPSSLRKRRDSSLSR